MDSVFEFFVARYDFGSVGDGSLNSFPWRFEISFFIVEKGNKSASYLINIDARLILACFLLPLGEVDL